MIQPILHIYVPPNWVPTYYCWPLAQSATLLRALQNETLRVAC